jgi:hypothetical protein
MTRERERKREREWRGEREREKGEERERERERERKIIRVNRRIASAERLNARFDDILTLEISNGF